MSEIEEIIISQVKFSEIADKIITKVELSEIEEIVTKVELDFKVILLLRIIPF